MHPMISAVSVTTSAAQVVASKGSRKWLIIQNVSDVDIFFKFDSSATALTSANGYKLAPGADVKWAGNTGDYINAIIAVHDGSGSKEIRVQED